MTRERGTSSIGIGAGGEADQDRFGDWVQVDDVDVSSARLQASGAAVVGGPADEPWGERVAHVRDPDGNLVDLGAAL